MNLKIDKSFEKDSDKVLNKKLLLKVADCIEQLINSGSLEEITNLKKLAGFKNHYRIRIGDSLIQYIRHVL